MYIEEPLDEVLYDLFEEHDYKDILESIATAAYRLSARTIDGAPWLELLDAVRGVEDSAEPEKENITEI